AIGLGEVFEWASPKPLTPFEVLEKIEKSRPYLNEPFFLARGFGYVALWAGLALLLRRWSLRSDVDPAPATVLRPRFLSAAMLPVMAITINFAAWDWLMTLSPAWHSSMFGIYVFAGGFAGAVAVAILGVFAAVRAGALPAEVGESHFHALGKLLLTAVVFWAYTFYFQGMLIWIANVPEETFWYSIRSAGPWLPVFWIVAGAQFAVPFAALLSRGLKRRPAPLAAVAAWVLLAHYVDVYWIVMPHALRGRSWPSWPTLVSLAAVVGVAGLAGLLFARVRSLPIQDPRALAGLEYETK
ncbi:MAG TPA: hypothetical protein VHF22_15275, partial [Planctomycetota bacterium]|nr:hypothetical protein [Planctomycetota bacterium]